MDQVNSDLIQYIKNAIASNIPKEQIIQNLLSNSWSQDQINSAFLAIENPIPSPQINSAPKPVQTPSKPIGSMFDTFLHILLFTSLYIGATALGTILYNLINHFFPPIKTSSLYSDLVGYYYNNNISNYVSTWALSSLVVTTPLYSIVFTYINKKTKDFPHIRQLRTRRTLTYLTLIITFFISIYRLIILLNSLFQGNLTINVFLKFFVVIVLSLGIFFYYFNEVREDKKQNA